jgi:hypothetical protein
MEAEVELLISDLEKTGTGFIFPQSEARKLKMDINIAREMLLVLYTEGYLNHYSIPKINDQIIFTEAVKGFRSKFIDLVDPDDFQPVSDDEVEVLSAYKVADLGGG